MARKKVETVTRDIEVTRAHQFEDGNISFDVRIDNVIIYQCSWIQSKKDGSSFVGFPSHLGKDKKTYYKYAFTQFTDAELEIIDKQLDEIL